MQITHTLCKNPQNSKPNQLANQPVNQKKPDQKAKEWETMNYKTKNSQNNQNLETSFR